MERVRAGSARVPGREPAVVGMPDLGRCRVMGVVNVTPDSFSDGGEFFDPDTAVAQGLLLHAQGADLVDVGGESTRPGAGRVDQDEESRRVVPVVGALVEAGVPVSVDTMRAPVAARALEAGARLVNDVSGGAADPDMARLVADAGVPYVVMHWRGHSADMQNRAVYEDVARQVTDELRRRVDDVLAHGVRLEQIVVDPGLGFAKTAEHSWTLLGNLATLRELGRPVLVGASRKGFLGRLLAAPDGSPRPLAERADATAAVSALAARAGAWCVRVHEVPASVDAVHVAVAWRAAEEGRVASTTGATAGATS
ncbi:MAG: dihydropteroate synthase [Actinomycetes bacterium]